MAQRNVRARGARVIVAVFPVIVGAGCSDRAAHDDQATTSAAADAAKYDWPQFGFDAQHSGDDTREATLAASNVAQLQLLFQVALGGVADGAPILLTNVSTSGGARDLVFVTTKDGQLLARDARTGAAVWGAQHGPGSCHINGGSPVCYTTSSPAADPGRGFVYSYGLDGYVHKHAVGTGAEVTGGGWPELATSKPSSEKGSSALAVAVARDGSQHLYVANAGYPGDGGDYQGHVTIIDLASGGQAVFNTLCSDQRVHFTFTTPDCAQHQSAVWARPGVVYDADTDRIYAVTGNGVFDPAHHHWADTVFALPPAGPTGSDPVDTFTPTNQAQLNSSDQDLGSTAPAILPAPAASKVKHLGLQGGKDARLRLLNLDALGGGGTGQTGGAVLDVPLPQGGELLTTPAVWVDPSGKTWAFVANQSGLSALTLGVDANGNPTLSTAWKTSTTGTSPIVANGVLYMLGNLRAYAIDPRSGAVLWSDTKHVQGIHWESPIVANGVLYGTDQSGNLTAWSLPSTVPPPPVDAGSDAGVDAAPPPPPPPPRGAVKINFQPSRAPVPAGYLADTGPAFGDRGNGWSYGWNGDNSGQTRWRHSSRAPDERYDTLTHMQKPWFPNATWEIAVPNGTYSVRIVSGDPDNIDSVYRISAEGVLVIDGTPTATTRFFDRTATVTVADGRLTIASAPGSSNNKLDFIEITPH